MRWRDHHLRPTLIAAAARPFRTKCFIWSVGFWVGKCYVVAAEIVLLDKVFVGTSVEVDELWEGL